MFRDFRGKVDTRLQIAFLSSTECLVKPSQYAYMHIYTLSSPSEVYLIEEKALKQREKLNPEKERSLIS